MESGLKTIGRAENAIRLTWRGEDASCYLLERKVDDQWKKIVWIGDKELTSCRVEGLKPSTFYHFRLTLFCYDELYRQQEIQSYELVDKTCPGPVSGVKLVKKGDEEYLCWKKNPAAMGYIVYQIENRRWKRIARIGNKNTMSLKMSFDDEQMKKGVGIKIQAFDSNKYVPLYSRFTEIWIKDSVSAERSEYAAESK